MPRLPGRAAGLLLTALLVTACTTGNPGRVTTDTTATGEPVGNAPSGATAPEPPTSEAGAGAGARSGAAAGGGPVAPSGCEPSTPRGGEEAATVELDEWSVAPTPPNVRDGKVAFAVTNKGSQRHELLVVATPSPSGLPTMADGSVDEARLARGDVIGRVAAVPPGGACNATFELPAASYALICNLVGDGGSHYARGMVTAFSTG